MSETINVNKVIHEAIGLCWHTEFDHEDSFHCPQCKKCGEFASEEPDYSIPFNYCALMDWMREGMRHLDFDIWMENKNGCNGIGDWMYDKRQEQVNLIAEAITEGVFK